MMAPEVGILSAETLLPSKTKSTEEVFADEGVALTELTASRLGIQRIHVAEDPDPTAMAVEVAQMAILSAGLAPSEIDVIIDFSVLPQKYVEPAWSMSNEIQHRIAAKGAFTLGFSGGGATNFHVALNFGSSLLKSGPEIQNVLLVASDRAIPGNRILDRDNPVSILGDASSAIVLSKEARNGVVLDTCLSSEGSCHEISCIRGGGIAYPDRLDLYRMSFDHEKFSAVNEMSVPQQLVDKVLKRHSLTPRDVKYCLYPNLSRQDQIGYVKSFGIEQEFCAGNCRQHGHVQASDFVLNYQGLQRSGIRKGDHALVVSHGHGFLAGVSLIRY